MASDGAASAYDFFGSTVAINGGTIVIGADVVTESSLIHFF